MIRWLLIILFIYLVIRIIRGPKQRKRPSIRFHFGNFQNGRSNRTSTQSKRPRLDDIEDAEFEDITEKAKEEDDS